MKKTIFYILPLISALSSCIPENINKYPLSPSEKKEKLVFLRGEYSGKSIKEIRADIANQIQSIENVGGFKDLILDVQSDEPYTSQLAEINADKDTINLINENIKKSKFSQKIVDGKSLVFTQDISLTKIIPGYDAYGFPNDAGINIYQVNFIDGSSYMPVKSQINKKVVLDSLKRVKSLTVSINYSLPYDMVKKTFELSEEADEYGDGISVKSIDNSLLITLSSVSADEIFSIEAKDVSGKVLKNIGKKSYTHNPVYEKLMKNALNQVVNKIDKTPSISNDELITFISDVIPSEKMVEKENPPVTTMQLNYMKSPVSVSLYFKSKTKEINNTLILSGAEDNNKFMIGTGSNGKWGVLSPDGKWLVQPEFDDLTHIVGDFYYVHNILYKLNADARKLIKQSFYIIQPDIIDGHYIEVSNSPYDNYVKGLYDIAKNELIIPVRHSSILVTEFYFIIDDYDEHKNQHNSTILKKSDNSLVMKDISGVITVSRDRFCVETDTLDKQGYTKKNINIFNSAGEKLNQQNYYLHGMGCDFGKDNLLLVEDYNGSFLYIDRDASVKIPPSKELKYAGGFSNGFAKVQYSDNVDIAGKEDIHEKYGYINNRGELIIPPKYTDANDFIGGSALVSKDGHTMLITPEDKVIFLSDDTITSYTAGHDKTKVEYYFFKSDDSTKYVINQKGEKIKASSD